MSVIKSDLESPITDVTIENPYNLQDFESDKLSILDIKAMDQSGAIYDIEMQLTVFTGLVQRIVFYGCELYAGQLKAGEDYDQLCAALFDLFDRRNPVEGRDGRPSPVSVGRPAVRTGVERHSGNSHAGIGTVYFTEAELPTANTCWNGGCSGCCMLTNTNRTNCCGCFRRRRFSRQRERSRKLHKRRKTKPCTTPAKKRSATINPPSTPRTGRASNGASKLESNGACSSNGANSEAKS